MAWWWSRVLLGVALIKWWSVRICTANGKKERPSLVDSPGWALTPEWWYLFIPLEPRYHPPSLPRGNSFTRGRQPTPLKINFVPVGGSIPPPPHTQKPMSGNGPFHSNTIRQRPDWKHSIMNLRSSTIRRSSSYTMRLLSFLTPWGSKENRRSQNPRPKTWF